MASDINTVTIVGRLTRDAELRQSESGTSIMKFSIANTQSRKSEDRWVEESHFFDAVLFGRRAEALQNYLTKGKQVVLLGSLQHNRWQDKQTGEKRSRVEIIVNDIQLVGGRSDNYSAPTSASSEATKSDALSANQIPEDKDFDDDIPF